ncbi:MAG: emp24/gp25L/p24 family protein [Thaumarchaeota archaeon]|nr:emp24/gp25L/p24 family protein [Nitrososphaerota archaeon]
MNNDFILKSSILITALFVLTIFQPLLSYSEKVETIVVPPGNTGSVTVNLTAGEKFVGSFTVSGGIGNDIKFWISNPLGKGITLQQDVTEGKSVTFTADQTGIYTLNFDNSFAEASSKKITLTYETKPSEETSNMYGGGCLIVTATFGSELAPQVQFLREIRDNTVLSTASGTSFMTAFNSFYYSFSPAVADLERQNPAFKEFVKLTITPLLSSLSLLQYVDVDSESEMLGYGLGIILLNIGMYFVVPAIVIVKLKSRKSGDFKYQW